MNEPAVDVAPADRSAFNPALIVPVYQHGAAFRKLLPQLTIHGLAVIVVDDGSGPETASLLDELAATTRDLIVVRHAVNQGKGGAVITGLISALDRDFTHALQIDADGQHEPADIPRFLAASMEHPEAMIVGVPEFDRSVPQARRIARYLTHVMIWIETLSLDIADSMCGFRVYPLTSTVPLLRMRPLGRRMDFDPEILVRLHWADNTIIGIPTAVTYPVGGRSNFRLLRDNVLISAMHCRLVVGMFIRLPKIFARRWAKLHE